MQQERRSVSLALLAIAFLHFVVYSVCCVHAPAQAFLLRECTNFRQVSLDQTSLSVVSSSDFPQLTALAELARTISTLEAKASEHTDSAAQSLANQRLSDPPLTRDQSEGLLKSSSLYQLSRSSFTSGKHRQLIVIA